MSIVVDGVRTERLVDPIGLGTATPRFSWRLTTTAGERDVLQYAWQLQAGAPNGENWDTGRIDGRDQHVVYAGPPLASRARGWWRVRAWTTAGETRWSERASFELGLLDPRDWAAKMIGARGATPVVALAKSFDAPAYVAAARLYVTAHGAFVATLNGAPVSDDVLAPGWTSYHRRLVYRTYDVTPLLRDGANDLEAFVAPGWFSGRFGLRSQRGFYGDHVGLLAQLELTTVGGERMVIPTDESWQASSTGYLQAEIYDGETYDARVETGAPAPVHVDDLDRSILVAPPVPPVRRTQTIAPVSRKTIDGALQVDFGQNLVGWMRLRVRGARSGAEIVMRHAEVLGPDGRLFTEPLRTAKATDTYIARGDVVESYEPQFTFHGFRYAEITGADPDMVDVEAVVVHSDLERTGSFECSDPLINRLHENVVWSWRGNSVSVPTDCPQRDERLGWTGDAQVFSPVASFLVDGETFWENWLADVAADQRDDGCVPPVVPTMDLQIGDGACGWGDAAVVVPISTYEAFGDPTVLQRALPSMVAWVDYVHSRLDDDNRWVQDFQFGDWLDPDAPTDQPWRAKARYDLVATAYAARATDLLVRAAAVLGEDGLVGRYAKRAETIRASWLRNYADRALTTQTGCALAIEFGLVPDDDVARFGDALVELVRDADTHLATGFLGTPLLLPALTASGHLDVAYEVLQQRTPPSWLHQVLAGATTIWERWDALREDGSVPLEALGGTGSSMVSFNHYAYGAVAHWLHTTVAGLRPGAPGYRHVTVAPKPGGGIRSARAGLTTRYGPTAVAWRIDDHGFVMDVTIPPGATATVVLPDATSYEVGSGAGSYRCRAP
jgi:alpha-L-rhamnosidase